MTKIQALIWWGVPVSVLGGIIGAIAIVLNWLTDGTLATLLGIIAIVITTIIGTAYGVLALMWIEIE